MKSLINKLILLSYLFFTLQANSSEIKDLSFDLNNKKTLNYLIESQIKDQYKYSGLATYLNQIQYYVVDTNQIITLDRNKIDKLTLLENQWLAVVGRFNVLLIKSKNISIKFSDKQQLSLESQFPNPTIKVLNKTQLAEFAIELDQIRYHHLWKPFAIVAKLSESLLVLIKNITSLSWGITILVFALIIKLLLLPVSILTAKSQQRVSKINSQLQPRLAEIKNKYIGEKAHHFSMKAHKDLGVSPFYTLKPMLSFLIQIPVLIAIFNALGEMPQLINQPFLWFNDLSQPDMLMPLGFLIPLLGEHLNLMPIIMTFITLLSTILYKDNHASESDNRKQKLKLYLMSASFLILFYPFPAAMVLYWAMANLLGFVQQKLMK